MKFVRVVERVSKSRYIFAAFMMVLSMFSTFPISDVAAQSTPNLTGKNIQEVQTGFDAACALIEGWPYCWGANDYGQLGNGTRGTTATTKPTAVSSDKTGKPAGPAVCTAYFLIFCTATAPGTPAVPPSAMAGLEVDKVSVGYSHACAIASAKVYCWGDNTYGQLGDRTTTDSLVPVKVDVQNKDAAGKPKSALAQKEIIDVTAGGYFTCALASDGTTACWGAGEQGRLGTGNENNANYPVAVDTQAGSPLAGKKGIKLARASVATMCVLAVPDAAFGSAAEKGNPYCWGVGIGNDAIPGPGRVTVPCSKNSPTVKPTGSGSITTYFTSASPIQISNSQLFTQVDGVDYLTGRADNNRAYYWGMHGYRENNSYVSYTTCSVNPCTSANPTIKLAATASQQKAKAKANAQNNNKPGGDKNKNLNSNNTAQQSAQNAAHGGVSSSVSSSGGNLVVRGSLTNTQSYSTSIAQSVDGNNVNVTSYRGVARPGVSTSNNNSNVGNNNNKPSNGGSSSCGNVTHYGYVADRTVTEVGKMTPTVPHATSLNQTNISVLSGNVESGLFCAKNASGTFCDANGTPVEQGQTGSNYTKQCVTTGFIFTTTTCSPAPTGPQQVVASGWLSGKSIQQLSTGLSGYTCALANNSIGCWGTNYVGQLGTGDTVNKLVPTALKLQ